MYKNNNYTNKKDLLIIYPYKVNNDLSIVSNQDDLTVKTVRSQFRPKAEHGPSSRINILCQPFWSIPPELIVRW
jgi:hypothetical protein